MIMLIVMINYYSVNKRDIQDIKQITVAQITFVNKKLYTNIMFILEKLHLMAIEKVSKAARISSYNSTRK